MFQGKRCRKKGHAGTNKMKKYKENGAVIVLVTAAACILFMFSGGTSSDCAGHFSSCPCRHTGTCVLCRHRSSLLWDHHGCHHTCPGAAPCICCLGDTKRFRRFGPESLGLLFGITYVGHQIGAFISSWLGGIFITNSGNYQAVWLIDIVLCTAASAASFSIRKERT